MRFRSRRVARLSLRFLAALMLGGLLGLPALADTRRVPDREGDVPGFLDVVLAVHSHAAPRPGTGPRIKHKIVTADAWRSRHLSWCGSINIWIRTSTGFRNLEIYYDNGLKAKMTTGDGRVVGRPNVWRPNRRSVATAFPARYLGRGVSSYRWRVGAGSSAVRCSRGTAIIVDEVPEEGSIRHQL